MCVELIEHLVVAKFIDLLLHCVGKSFELLLHCVAKLFALVVMF